MTTLETERIKNPLEDEDGLSPEANQHVLDTREQHRAAVGLTRELDNRSSQDYSRTIGREINEMIEEVGAKRKVKNLGKEMVKDYNLDPKAFQAQAVQDAAAEGVYTDFDGTVAKKAKEI